MKLPSRMVFLLKIISDIFLKKPLMLRTMKTGKNFCHGILKLHLIRFVENGFKLWYNYVNVNSICGFAGSRAAVCSSRRSRAGFDMTAIKRVRACLCPPENCSTLSLRRFSSPMFRFFKPVTYARSFASFFCGVHCASWNVDCISRIKKK